MTRQDAQSSGGREEGRKQFEQDQRRIYEIALHDVRRAIDTLAPDDHLIGHIYRRLARAVAEAYDVASPFSADWPHY